MYHTSLKRDFGYWVKDIKDEKAKADYIRYRRISKICDYLCSRLSKQFVRKNLIKGQHYRNEYNSKIYVWNGKYMQMLKTNGEIATNKFDKTVSITNFTEWVKLPY